MTTYPNLFVISRTWEEYEKFKINCLNNSKYSDHKMVYVSSVNILRGYNNPDGVFIGEWWERSDIDDIMLVLLASVHRDKNDGLKTALRFLHTKRGPTRIDGKTV
jgi:hypothetical protein